MKKTSVPSQSAGNKPSALEIVLEIAETYEAVHRLVSRIRFTPTDESIIECTEGALKELGYALALLVNSDRPA